MKTEKNCDNCIYSIPDWINVCNSDHYCSNEESEEYGYNAEYLNGCDEWESIEPNLGNTGSICTKTGGNDEDRTTGDTIYRRAAIEELMEHFKRVPTTAIRAKKVIEKLPSAQTEIIRCKDCRHLLLTGGNESTGEGIYTCNVWRRKTFKGDGFCSCAERRTE